jgi:hypothetical protein
LHVLAGRFPLLDLVLFFCTELELSVVHPPILLSVSTPFRLSISPSANCITVTIVNRHALIPPCPTRAYSRLNATVSNNTPNSSRIAMYTFPLGQTACAKRRVSSGISPILSAC